MSKIKVSSGFTSLKMLLFPYKEILVVYDRNVKAYAEKITGSRPSFAIDADEAHKTMDTVMNVCRWLLDNGADKRTLVLAVGGGTTTDIVGFAASIFKRGIRYANVPTTLLAQVDAAIGGKTGVNLDHYKNMLGLIREPEFTYICTGTLRTLPEREFRSGAAEMLKTFIIKDDGNYEKALKIAGLPVPDIEALTPLIEAAAKTKRKIVSRDPDDEGRRRVLNLGHTWAHAIEWWQHATGALDPYTHGEAVAIGIVQAARMSEQLKLAREGLAAKIKADFEYCGLPTELPCDESELQKAFDQDKKRQGGRINYVLIKSIGSVTVKKI